MHGTLELAQGPAIQTLLLGPLGSSGTLPPWN
jgi:hypothetical protein